MDEIRVEVSPPVGWIVFNRPEVMNAFNMNMWKGLPQVAASLDEHPDVKVIIMRGEGGVFGAGADIRELLEYTEEGRAQEYADAVNFCFSGLSRVEKPMIAAIERYALGGGCMVALSCDLRVAGNSAKIGIPLVKLGLAVEPLGIKRLFDVAGYGFAAEFLLTGDVIPREKLAASGLVNIFVEDDRVVDAARELAERLAENSNYALRKAKSILKQFASGKTDPEFLRRAFASCMETEEFRERARRFLNK